MNISNATTAKAEMSEGLLPAQDLSAKPAIARYLLVDLGTLGGSDSFGRGINGHGQVVGYSGMPGNKMEHALSPEDQARCLLGWAIDINDLGQITGIGMLEDGVRAFLLTPISSAG